ncbi:hypothetical protein Pmani_001615 [Petrolisthes manimaculis]|uniref:Pro-resilin n=1 Tax=Petrolisthes manimaculis TaxID=1843537 RepID=A0AAE1QKB6_9EUCA|nr:hypothetical protein Pmani_001615 [Petrolisthes manimaculis]
MGLVVVVVVVLVAVTGCIAHPTYDSAPGAQGQQPTSPAIYTYQYTAQDSGRGQNFGHAEQRDGQSSSGEYRVLLPDGRTQVVTYTVEGDSGYVAKVSYEGGSGNVNQQQATGGYN